MDLSCQKVVCRGLCVWKNKTPKGRKNEILFGQEKAHFYRIMALSIGLSECGMCVLFTWIDLFVYIHFFNNIKFNAEDHLLH
jgi:hypothetical protein